MEENNEQKPLEKQQSFEYRYDLPENKDAFVDTKKGEIVKKEDIDPFQSIKAIAKQTGTVIREPRSGCRHCYGRGYIGIESKTRMPIPCSCIYPPKSPNDKTKEHMYDSNRINAIPNRAQRRALRLNTRRTLRKNPALKKRLHDIVEQKIKEQTSATSHTISSATDSISANNQIIEV